MPWRNTGTFIITSLAVLPFIVSRIGIPGATVDVVRPDQDSILRGAYFGQEPPGLEPEIFAPGVVSTAAGEGCIVFSADGRRVVFRRFGLAWFRFGRPRSFGRSTNQAGELFLQRLGAAVAACVDPWRFPAKPCSC